jgi:hypothetical protein
VLLVAGVGRRTRRLTTWGACAAALLLGAVITTGISVVNDMQFDSYNPGGRFVAGAHVTTFGLGFWLELGAAVVALAGLVLLLLRERRVEPPTPRFGIPVQSVPVPGTQAPGYPPQQFPGPQHG